MTNDTATKFPDVSVQLTGTDGNVFCIISNVMQALRRAGYAEAAKTFQAEAMASESYDAVLVLCMETVEVS